VWQIARDLPHRFTHPRTAQRRTPMSDETLIEEPPVVPGPLKIAARAKKPLDVEYDGTVYRLPGRIPPELLTAQAGIRRPTMQTKDQKEEYGKQVGVSILAAFYEIVLPADFKAAIDLEDVEPVFQAWSDHVELGKSQNSSGS
jgi:hypothetical protein